MPEVDGAVDHTAVARTAVTSAHGKAAVSGDLENNSDTVWLIEVCRILSTILLLK